MSQNDNDSRALSSSNTLATSITLAQRPLLTLEVVGKRAAARSVRDSLGVRLLEVASGPLTVEEAGDSVIPQAKLASNSIAEGKYRCLF